MLAFLPIVRFLGLLCCAYASFILARLTVDRKTANLRRLLNETPVALSTVSGCGVLLPEVIESGEQDDVLGELGLDAVNGSLLVFLAWNSGAIGGSLPWPARLGDDDLLATTCGSDTLRLLKDELAGILGGDTTIEEGVGVGSSVVGALAKLWVGDHGNEGVDSDDWTSVASSLEDGTGSVDSGDNGSDATAGVDDLVTNGHSVDGAPVALDGGDDGSSLGLNRVDVEDTDEKLHALSSGSSLDGVDLVAVGAVDTDETVTGDLCEVGSDLVLRLASTIIVVWRVHDTLARCCGWS